MNILVISMREAGKRRRFQEEQMAQLRLSFRFLDAFDAADLSVADCQQAANSWPSPTLRQDVACFRSHRLAWSDVVASGRQTLILEDGAVLSDRLPKVLDRIEGRNDRWNAAYDLEYVLERHLIARHAFWRDADTGSVARRVFQNRLGLAAYVIGPDTARRMIRDTRDYALVDARFWSRWWLCSYQIEPAPAIQLRFLEAQRASPQFSRPGGERLYRPENRLRKHGMRLLLEATKARNALTGWLRAERRMIEIERSHFGGARDAYKERTG